MKRKGKKVDKQKKTNTTDPVNYEHVHANQKH